MNVSTTNSQKIPELLQEVKYFFTCIKQLKVRNGYTNYNIGNMDQIMCFIDMPFKRTNNLKGELSVHITKTKCRIKIYLFFICSSIRT